METIGFLDPVRSAPAASWDTRRIVNVAECGDEHHDGQAVCERHGRVMVRAKRGRRASADED
jgi:hypothetical protein